MTTASYDPVRTFLRHSVATLAYRAAKALRDAPAGFEAFSPGDSSRSAGQILAHMGDLFDWALAMASGAEKWHDATPMAWPQESVRFFAALTAFDQYLASDAVLHIAPERLLQGPIADALTHTGQITMLRRLAGAPVRGESYNRAQIEIGRTGMDQHPPKREF